MVKKETNQRRSVMEVKIREAKALEIFSQLQQLKITILNCGKKRGFTFAFRRKHGFEIVFGLEPFAGEMDTVIEAVKDVLCVVQQAAKTKKLPEVLNPDLICKITDTLRKDEVVSICKVV